MEANFQPPVIDPSSIYKGLPKDAFDSYRAGETLLCVWRNSSPHNWYLERISNKEIVYHWPEFQAPAPMLRSFSDMEPSSGPKVSYGGFRPRGYKCNDEGLHQSDTWRFNEERYQEVLKHWEYAKECAKSFNDLAGTRELNLRSLSSEALVVARAVKKGQCEFLPEYAASVERLCSMGLVRVDPQGYLKATQLLRSAPLSSSADVTYSELYEPSLALRARMAEALCAIPGMSISTQASVGLGNISGEFRRDGKPVLGFFLVTGSFAQSVSNGAEHLYYCELNCFFPNAMPDSVETVSLIDLRERVGQTVPASERIAVTADALAKITSAMIAIDAKAIANQVLDELLKLH